MSNPTADPASKLPGLFANLRANSDRAPVSSSIDAPASCLFDFTAPSSSTETQIHTSTQAPQARTFSPSSSSFNTHQSIEPANLSTPTRPSASSGAQSSSAQMTNPLLNLLKFGPTTPSPQTTPQPPAGPLSRPEYGGPSTHSVHGRGISASDLVASFTNGKPSTPTPREKQTHSQSSSTNHQDALLKLLNQTTARAEGSGPKSADTTGAARASDDPSSSSFEARQTPIADVKGDVSGRNESPMRFFGGASSSQTPASFEPKVSPEVGATQKGIFTYENPFEHLAASSPRHLHSKSPANGDAHKRKVKSPSPAAVHSSSRRKLTPSGNEVLQSVETSAPGRAEDPRSQIEALMGIGAPTRNAETVAEALNEVGSKVDRQVESALAQAEEVTGGQQEGPDFKREAHDDADEPTLADIQAQAHDIAVDVQHELQKDENQGLLEESMPKPVAEAVKDIIDEAADGHFPAVDYNSADGEEKTAAETDRIIHVYQFPMRPFVAIDLIQKEPAHLALREDSVVNIARMKKEFDQADRSLATASNEFIAYGMPKSGGVRVIRQDSGLSSLLFSNTQDRVFNVAISTAPSTPPMSPFSGYQTVIATGISGTVYWATIAKPGEELSQDDMEKQGLIIPPLASQSDSPSGGQLKTRAKKSNRHPDFFAIGRGKSIHLIFSMHAQSSDCVNTEGVMDTERYFTERNLKITTGKAGKDFTFSEDDTAIVTLDKAGKLRIWDIRDLINESNVTSSMLAPVEVKTPILTFNTANSTEKSWPTSVLFVDKHRPYLKGTALRYIIVGMKQNHTLQLWDLCLGKAVQELNFPHDKETDPICSVAYHPGTGIIAVGHPTRNSIYFIHLSAPKYNLQTMSQARFVSRLAAKDSTLAKAEATAIMSGMREYSFGEIGQLRSLELVPSSGETARSSDDEEDPMLFELYVMHSKGVTCLTIKKEDLGWSKDSRVLHSLDAEQEGHIIIKDLREPSVSTTTAPSELSMIGDEPAPTASLKAKAPVKELSKPGGGVSDSGEAALKTEKKKAKRSGASEVASRVGPMSTNADSYTAAAQSPSISSKESGRANAAKHAVRDASESNMVSSQDKPVRPVANGDSISVGISGDFLDRELKKIEAGVSQEFNKVLGEKLEKIYNRFAEDKRVQDAAGAAKQDAVLRLVSSTLTENVEKSLSDIVQKNVQAAVVPAIAKTTSTSLNETLPALISKQLHDTVPGSLKAALPDAVGNAISKWMSSPNVLTPIAEKIAKAMTGHVEKEFSTTLHNKIIPVFSNLAFNAAQNAGKDIEHRVQETLQQTELQHSQDSNKIDQLTDLVRGLSETVQGMAAAQSDLKLEILKLQQKVGQDSQALARQQSLTPGDSISMHVSPEQEELDNIATSMNEGRFEEATIMVGAAIDTPLDVILNIISGFNQIDKSSFSTTFLSAATLATFAKLRC